MEDPRSTMGGARLPSVCSMALCDYGCAVPAMDIWFDAKCGGVGASHKNIPTNRIVISDSANAKLDK